MYDIFLRAVTPSVILKEVGTGVLSKVLLAL